mmetsp:Transcript_68005/g.208419  ORF Transcript_68005/g.208419 Transcript_68005/m.208419 type:complete len:200 (+) Transcript_68005:207-806(+)
MNSHTPSEHSSTNRQSGCTVHASTSGSPVTPAVAPTVSPMDRVVASPGYIFPGRKTRCGMSPSKRSTCPPASWIRCLSRSHVGLWSVVRSRLLSSGPQPVARTARESPTCATKSVPSRIIAMVAVVPLSEESKLQCVGQAAHNRLVARKALLRAFFGSPTKSGSCAKALGNVCCVKFDMTCPYGPCPSNTPKMLTLSAR